MTLQQEIHELNNKYGVSWTFFIDLCISNSKQLKRFKYFSKKVGFWAEFHNEIEQIKEIRTKMLKK